MKSKKPTPQYSPEIRERAVRMVQEHRGEYPSLWAAIESIAPKIGCVPQTLHEWGKKHEIDTGLRDGVSTDERERLKALEREVKRLVKRFGLAGVRRGKVVRTKVPDHSVPCPLDRVNRQFKADCPNQLWVADYTYVSTWQGRLYVAFVIDVFARRIVGWRVSHSMRTDFVLDALEQALYARQPERADALIHDSDRGSQYVSIRYTERLAETINGLYKAELIHRRAPWKSREAVELATQDWVAWFNNPRLLESIGYIPPAEAEANYYRRLADRTVEAT